MPANGDMEENVEQEREIPVFTVVKNNAILKNIFLINSGSSISETHRQDSSNACQGLDQILVVGRHPDCDIRLEHPSISRFHLQIHSKPSAKRLLVTDLSSVHGTWISGNRIQPNVPMDVNEGDELRIGVSSRVYRLHWIPFHKAYDPDNPFVPPLDVPPPDEEKEEEIQQDENAPVLENEMQSENSASPTDLLSNQSETSVEMEDVKTLLCEDKDEDALVLGCECSLDSALVAIKALVSNQFEGSKDIEDDNTLVCKNERPIDSLLEASENLASTSICKSSQEADVLLAAPVREAMKAVDVPLESRDMQFVNFAWDGSETLLFDRIHRLVAQEENEASRAMQQNVDYSHMGTKYERISLVLKLEDDMSISGDIEEDGEKEGNISGSSTEPFGELAVNLLQEKELEEEEKDNEHQQTGELAVNLLQENEFEKEEKDNEHQQTGELAVNLLQENEFEEEEKDNEHQQTVENEGSTDLFFSQELSLNETHLESSSVPSSVSDLMDNFDGAKDLLFSKESFLSKSHLESSSVPSSTSDLMDNLDGEITESFFAENEYEKKGLDDLLFSEVTSLTESQMECSSEPDLTSNLMMNLDDAISKSSKEETNEYLMPPCDDEEMDCGWSFWSLSNQGLEVKNTRQDRKSLEEPSSGVPQNLLWSFWSGISGEDSVHLSSLSNSPCSIRSMEVQCSEPSESSPYRSASSIGNNEVGNNLEEQYITPKKENRGPSTETAEWKLSTIKHSIDSENSLAACSNKENMTPKVIWEQKTARLPSEEHTKSSILYKNETQRTPLRALFANSPQKSVSEDIFAASLSPFSNKENPTAKALQEQKSAKQSSAKCMKLPMMSKGDPIRTPLQTLFADSPQKSSSKTRTSGGASFSACFNKENQTPMFLQKEQKSVRHSSAKCRKLSMPLPALFADSPQNSSSYTRTSSDVSLSVYSDKENQTPKSATRPSAVHSSAAHTKLFSYKKQEPERMPLQTLFVDTPQENIPYTRIPTTCENSMDKEKCSKQQVKRWTMVVDIASLLNKTSRKALQLLEGIKGTQLIIPTAVIKELDAMKQRVSFFRKNTDAKLASQWIEECAVRRKWWIRIHNSMENDALLENVSASMEDQMLDFALNMKRIQKNGQLVLLSDDSVMKIEAMAEGLICETAEEFRESLVNPSSRRFLWPDSLPRGRTWSYLDNVIRMDKLYPGAMKATTRKGMENAMGLKLILLY